LRVGANKAWIDLLTAGLKELSFSGHTHNYAATSHTHTKSQITDFPSTMTPTSHTHTVSEITDMPTLSEYTKIAYGSMGSSRSFSVSFYPIVIFIYSTAKTFMIGSRSSTSGVLVYYSSGSMNASITTCSWYDNSVSVTAYSSSGLSYYIILGT
jgi:hypothetical protein